MAPGKFFATDTAPLCKELHVGRFAAHLSLEKVMMMERVYHEGIREPLHWIALAVFEPTRFRAAYEQRV